MKTYFISDLHLGASYNAKDREAEIEAVAFLDSISKDADELYLLGDVLDYWYEYKYVVPRGFVRFFGKLASLSDAGVKITWIIGNHDIWIFDYLPRELGITVIDGIVEAEVESHRFSMQHGDAIGGNKKFRFMRWLFRNRFCQILYSGLHPRWTVGFAHGWSRHSRMKRGIDKMPPNLLESIREWCDKRIQDGDEAEYFVFGHLHRQAQESLPDNRKLIVLPDWNSTRKYGLFDGSAFEIRKFHPEK